MSDFRERARNHLRTAAGTYKWAGHVDLAGGASGKIMQRRRMSGSCPEFKDFKPASAPTAARSGL